MVRNLELTSFISEIGKVIKNFPERLGYGGSMGGGAAGSFAELLNLDRLLLLNLITTLNKDIVPWETRFQKYASLNWQYIPEQELCKISTILYRRFMKTKKIIKILI